MAICLGTTNISDIRIGAAPISKICLGEKEVWSAFPKPTNPFTQKTYFRQSGLYKGDFYFWKGFEETKGLTKTICTAVDADFNVTAVEQVNICYVFDTLYIWSEYDIGIYDTLCYTKQNGWLWINLSHPYPNLELLRRWFESNDSNAIVGQPLNTCVAKVSGLSEELNINATNITYSISGGQGEFNRNN